MALPETTLGESARADCESAIRRFEDAWHGAARPDILDFILPGSPHSTELINELAHIDIEFRLRAGEFARADDYFERFRELTEAERAIELIAAEFRLRNRHCPPAWPEEYWLRFPEHLATLRHRLPANGTGWFEATRPAERPGASLHGLPAIAGYTIEGELGRGGMGVVYKARDLILHRSVAIKTFATVPRPENCVRFAREAEAIAHLDHPHIVPIFEVGEWHTAGGGPAVPYFVMKWYRGGSLDASLSGPGSNVKAQSQTVEIIARAVHHAHQRGILHRDLKPSNILLDDSGWPHVADFGLAGRIDTAWTTDVVAGTPAYMAPEQARSPKDVSTAADVYGLGAILYHQLTGRAPFDAQSPLATLELVANAAPPRPSTINAMVPRDLDTICLKCLEKDPVRRYASAEELAEDLKRYREGLPIAARPIRTWEAAWRQMRRHPVVTALAATTFAALLSAVAILWESNARIRAQEHETNRALGNETIARKDLEEALEREHQALYLERIASAGRLYASNQLPEAWQLLDLCPPRLCGWEWRYLDSLRRAERVTLSGHDARVYRVEHLPDGRVISGDGKGRVRVWNMAARKTEHEWGYTDAPIAVLAPHPTKPWVAVGDHNAIAVREVSGGKLVCKLAGMSWAAFSPDGKHAATADRMHVRLWTATGDEKQPFQASHVLPGHINNITAGVFTLDGRRLITSSVDRTVRTWDLQTGKLLGTRSTPTPVTSLALADNDKLLAEAQYGTVLVTDLATGDTRDRLEYPTGDRPVVSARRDGRQIAVSGANGEIVIWDVSSSRAHRVFRGHDGRVVDVSFGPNGRIASIGYDNLVRLWDAAHEVEVRTIATVGDGLGGLTISHDGRFIAVGPRAIVNARDVNAILFDMTTGRETRRVPAWPDIVFDPVSPRLVTSRRGGGVSVRDATDGRELWSKPFSKPRDPPMTTVPGGRRLAVSSDGSRIALWSLSAGGIEIWNATTGDSLGVLDIQTRFVTTIAFVPKRNQLLVCAANGNAMWDLDTNKRIEGWGDGLPATNAVAFSADGTKVATADADRLVRIRDAATGRLERTLIGPALRANVLCFDPDGTRLLTGSLDRTVRLWHVASGRELLQLAGPTEGVTGVAWDASTDSIFALDHAVLRWSAAP